MEDGDGGGGVVYLPTCHVGKEHPKDPDLHQGLDTATRIHDDTKRRRLQVRWKTN